MALAGRNRRPITAAAQRIGFSREAADRIKEEPWQDRAWQVYEVEGSIYFMTRYRAAVARKIDYFTGIVQSPGDDPNRDATYDDDGELLSLGQGAKVLEAEGGPELVRRVVSELMVHWDVAGEAFLVRFDVDPLWRVLSTKELKKQKGSGFSWDQAPVDMGGIDPENVYRVWKPHPRNHWQADSPTKHVLEDAEELILLRRELKARSNSRMSAGILFLPDAIDMSPFGEDSEGTEDDVARWLTDAMALAVSDPGSTRSLAPLVMTMNRDDIAAVKWQTFERNWDVNLEHRDALLRSIATGLDVPPEILTGMADLNHWSAWLVSEQAVSQHVAPTVDDILDSLTVNWFRPLLEASAVDPDAYVLWRDLSPATVPPDQSEVAFKAFELGVISAPATRRVINMDEEDAPEIVEGQTAMDADELLKRINALGTLRRAGAVWESATAAVGLPPIELIPGLLPITVRAEGVVTNEEAVIVAAVLQALKEGGPPLASAAVTAATRRRIVATELADIDSELLAWVVAEADKEIDRLLKQVGVTAATDPLDESLLSRFGTRLEAQIAKAQERARGWVERLTGRRVSDENESAARSAGLQVILAGVLEAVRRRLFTPQGGPDPIDTGKIADILPPTTAIREGLSLAGGGPAVYEDGHTSELIGNGQFIQDELRQDGFVPELMVWRVGAPSHPFDPHERLGGTEFDSWDSPKLSITLDGQWISGTHYRPGDHKGCQCSVEMVFTQALEIGDGLGAVPSTPGPTAAINSADDLRAWAEAKGYKLNIGDDIDWERHRSGIQQSVQAIDDMTKKYSVLSGRWDQHPFSFLSGKDRGLTEITFGGPRGNVIGAGAEVRIWDSRTTTQMKVWQLTDERIASAHESGWITTANVYDQAVHEMGHVMEGAMWRGPKLSDPGNFAKVIRDARRTVWKSGRTYDSTLIRTDVSGYAATDDSSEFFAEMFTARNSPSTWAGLSPEAATRVNQFADLINQQAREIWGLTEDVI